MMMIEGHQGDGAIYNVQQVRFGYSNTGCIKFSVLLSHAAN